ncbi:MAG: T9SS type A sorting domain-containing protein, partial [Bacteroidia bacterium]
MLPTEAGQDFVMPAKDAPKTVNLSYTFPGGFKLSPSARTSSTASPTGAGYAGINIATENSIEEFYDLAVVAFIQNDDTKEILQSSWTVQDWAIGMKENVKNANDFNVYPNPANTSITIEWNGSKDASFRILDLNGKEVMSNNEL